MPGTILVSVLEFMNLPLSSSTSIRVSMGKIEYQIFDKGNFSFPLTSLRDDLIVKIQDSDGNEISRRDVHIRLILEKGVLEDNFPLGDGHLHLKLQFILSDEERDRIRKMRQSALRKKHGELLRSGQIGPKSDSSSSTIGSAVSPFRTNDEVSESPKKRLQHEAVSRLQGPVGSFDDRESGARSVGEAQLDQKRLNPNFADRYKSTKLVSHETNLTELQNKGKKPVNQSPSEKQPQGVFGSEEKSIFSRSSEQNDGSIPGRTPSNVKKMISAFEGGFAQDKRPHIKPPPTKFLQSSKIETKDCSKTQHLEKDNSCNIVPEGILQPDLNAAYIGSGTKGSKYKKIKENEESKTRSHNENGDENPGGPFNQVIRVAIIIGFGVLVLLTRQRKKKIEP